MRIYVYNKQIRYKLGEGKDIAFWKTRWIGNGTLAQQFPLLFIAAGEKDAMISEVGCWVEAHGGGTSLN